MVAALPRLLNARGTPLRVRPAVLSLVASEDGGSACSMWRVGLLPVLAAPALCPHVGHVVGLGAKEQMGRIDTRRIVAAVEHAQAIGDGAVAQHPRHPVAMAPAFAIPHATIAARIPGRCCPQPTLIRAATQDTLPEVGGKSLLPGLAPSGIHAGATTGSGEGLSSRLFVTSEEDATADDAGARCVTLPGHFGTSSTRCHAPGSCKSAGASSCLNFTWYGVP